MVRESRVGRNYPFMEGALDGSKFVYTPSAWMKGFAISSVPSVGETSMTVAPLHT